MYGHYCRSEDSDGWPTYREYPDGYEVNLGCKKNHWTHDSRSGYTIYELREILKNAEGCEDYTEEI